MLPLTRTSLASKEHASSVFLNDAFWSIMTNIPDLDGHVSVYLFHLSKEGRDERRLSCPYVTYHSHQLPGMNVQLNPWRRTTKNTKR